MVFELGKPPIIEGWIRATMIAAPDFEWSWPNVDLMLQSFGGDLTEFENLPEFTPKARRTDRNRLQTEIEIHVEPRYMRARAEDRSRSVQVGRNELLVTQGRSQRQSYPGFQSLLKAFLLALDRYRTHIQTLGVSHVELHYVDLVVVPEMYKQGTSPGDYFTGAPELPPDPFGDVSGVSWSAVLSRRDSQDLAQLAVQLQAPDGHDGRFRLDWHCWCPELPADDQGAVADRLTSAHNYLKCCFKALCKPVVWNLFEPK